MTPSAAAPPITPPTIIPVCGPGLELLDCSWGSPVFVTLLPAPVDIVGMAVDSMTRELVDGAILRLGGDVVLVVRLLGTDESLSDSVG